jgi:hypothetical protein
MRGLGAMSEKEFKTLTDAATSLDRKRMSEEAYTREIGKIESTLTAVEDRLRAQMPGAKSPANDSGWVEMVSPDGRPLRVPAVMAADAERRGAKRR